LVGLSQPERDPDREQVTRRQNFFAWVLNRSDHRDADGAALGQQPPQRVLDPPAKVAFVHIRQCGQLVDQDHNQRLRRRRLVQRATPRNRI
jgi:hypothetical protein